MLMWVLKIKYLEIIKPNYANKPIGNELMVLSMEMSYDTQKESYSNKIKLTITFI